MKFAKFVLPYIIVSPVVLAVFFIAMFLCCVSVETILHGLLYIAGMFSLFISKHAQDITVVSVAGPVAMLIAALFMNKAVYELKNMVRI